MVQTRSRHRLEENSHDTAHSPADRAVEVIASAAARPVSGLYQWQAPGTPQGTRAEFRLDVDGLFPLMAASGSEIAGLTQRVDWVARPLVATASPTGTAWSGPITYKNGATFQFQHTDVRIEPNGQLMRVTLSGGGPDRIRDFAFSSASFRPVEFEFDHVTGVTPVTGIRTFDHPNRPGSLPDEELTIDGVFRRAGFDVRASNGNSQVPLTLAGTNERWSDAEMHDAMQIHWSRFANRPQWSLWTLFAALHEDGSSLGGIMFDDIGPNHRQGTALFLKSFIANAPAGDTAQEAWVRRMAFWTAVHEMGHAFNLAHAWDKDASFGTRRPWMTMDSGFHLQTFMNYPYLYQSGTFSDANTVRFFRDFSFRFNDEELLFLRHAPERFVEMGGSNWFDNHAFEQADVSPVPGFRLDLRVNRPTPTFEALEPVVIELKLTNAADSPALLPDRLLRTAERMTVMVKRENRPAKQWTPFAHFCWQSKPSVLPPGESVYESLFVGAGGDGWVIDEPGRYTIQVCLRVNGEDVVSNPLTVRVTPPRSHDEEFWAQDFYTEDVARTLAFDGTRFLTGANDTLREVRTRFPDSGAAIHAAVALELPGTRPYKLYDPVTDDRVRAAGGSRGQIEVHKAEDTAAADLGSVLGDAAKAPRAAESLGHIDYRYYCEHCAEAQEGHGDRQEANDTRRSLVGTLKDRGVPERILNTIQVPAEAGETDGPAPRGRRRR